MRVARSSRPQTAKHRLVTVLQPYVPAYRVAFFDELGRLLKDADVDLRVVHGSPGPDQAERGDAVVGRWSMPIRSRTLTLRTHELRWRSSLGWARRSDVIIAELASTNLDTYLLALLYRRRLMLWGHGKAYVTDPSRLDARLELWLARRATRVFVYTDEGATYLRGKGYRADRITVVHNSTDTVRLRAAADAVTAHDLAGYRSELRLGDGPVACFIGSYDESKLLPLLFQAAELVHEELPGFRLLVAGAGPQQGLVDLAAGELPWVRSLPRADIGTMALIGRTAGCIVIPGRVGLVAVDALALGLPMVTTTYPHHAPEMEYLTDEVKFVAEQTARDLADVLLSLLTSQSRLDVASAAAQRIGGGLSVEAMASAFMGGLADRLGP